MVRATVAVLAITARSQNDANAIDIRQRARSHHIRLWCMTTLPRIRRLTGQLVAALVRDYGPEHAARMLEYAAAEIRAAADLYPSLSPNKKGPFGPFRNSLF